MNIHPNKQTGVPKIYIHYKLIEQGNKVIQRMVEYNCNEGTSEE
jgi:hypothetical protein